MPQKDGRFPNYPGMPAFQCFKKMSVKRLCNLMQLCEYVKSKGFVSRDASEARRLSIRSAEKQKASVFP